MVSAKVWWVIVVVGGLNVVFFLIYVLFEVFELCALCCSIIVLLQWGQRSYMPNLFLDLRNVLVSESVKVVGGHSPSVSKICCMLKFLSRRFVRTR